MTVAEILQYVHKDAFLHRLHPFTKIVFIVVASVMCLISTNMVFLALMVLAMMAFAAYGDLLTESLRQLKLILVMSVIFILITVIVMPNGDILGYLIPPGIPFIGGLVPVTTGGLTIGVVLTLRFMVLIFAFQLFLISTQPRDLVHTMEKAGLPIDYILMFIIALRFYPHAPDRGAAYPRSPACPGIQSRHGFCRQNPERCPHRDPACVQCAAPFQRDRAHH